MIKRTLLWTAIPNGVKAGNLHLVCLVSPRLSSDGSPATLTLGLFDEWKQWAKVADSIKFEVVVGNNPAVAATRVSPAPKLELWQALFAPSTFVRPFSLPDHTGRRVRSYPALNVANAIKEQYSDVAVTYPTIFPPATDLLEKSLFGDIGFPRSSGSEADHLNQLDARFTASIKALPPGPPEPLWDFLQVKRFHLVRPNAQPVEPKPVPEQLDFHQVLALLMEHPAIQRQLGLAFDLTVPIPGGLAANTSVRVVPVWQPAPGTVNRTPTTLATFGAGVFTPRSAGDVSAGKLALAGANFGVVAMDVDGAALKARQFADTVKRAWTLARSADTPDRYALPALRSGGIAVVRTGRAVRQVARFADAKAKDGLIVGGGALTLDAEGLLRGFRWHVYDVHSGRWYSLCRRAGEYVFTGAGLTVPIAAWEEGVVTAAATQRVDGSPLDFYQAEYLCRWHGESLVAPRPGKSLHREPGAPPEVPQTDPPPEFPLRTVFRPAPGSLPPLRFGRRYRLRGYAGYVSGAGLPFIEGDTSTDFSHATAEWTYARLEPIPPPEVVMRRARTAGESLHHLVIRTNYDTDPASTDAVERHIVPPKTSQLMAEQHGMFDLTAGLDPNSYDLIGKRAGAELTGGVSDPANNGRPYFDVNELSFHVEGGGAARLPWLADPFARGAALFGLPGVPAGEIVPVDFGKPADWPNLLPFRLKLVEGSGGPVPVTGSDRVLEVRLGKADVAEVELSCFPHAADLQQLQVWRWVEHDASPAHPGATVEARRKEAVAGRNWLITPKQKLVLVCATRQPLAAPGFQSPIVSRSFGQTHATISDTLTISRKSTGSVELRAQWTDLVDELAGSTWQPSKQVTKTADLGETLVAKTPGGDTLSVSRRHDFADTKYHAVSYTAVAKSRFAEYFAERRTVSLTGTTPVVLDARGVSRHSEEVSAPGGTAHYVRGADYDLDYDAGTISRRTGGTVPDPGSVEVRFLPPISRQSPTAVLQVRSSARPAPPAPLFVLPTFGWDLTRPSPDPVLPGDALSRRIGNGLRIYLDRQWWSSGRDEQLAVVLLNAPAVPDDLRPYVTAWGMDPVFHSTPVSPNLPQPTNFPKRTANPGPVALAERAGQHVLIAPHVVAPDLKRRLWYCDLELSAGTSYFPFVRLALARYQPNAMPGVELSPVALADFAQLAPNRWVSLAHVSDVDVRVTVAGHSYLATAGSSVSRGKVVVTVERRDPKIPGDLGWVSAGEFPFGSGSAMADGRTVWMGAVALPARRGTEPMRIVVREYERFSNDSTGERLAFTDVIDVV